MRRIRCLRSVSLCSAFVLACWGSASAQVVNATTAKITTRAVIGGTTFGDVLRIVGSGTVSSGTGTMNPVVVDADGDVLEDTSTTVSTAGAYTWSAAGSFTSTLGVTGVLSGNTGTLLLGSPTRISGTTPSFRIHESDAGTSAKYSIFEADTESLYLKFCDDTPSACNSVFRVDRTALVPGDWRWGSLLTTIRPENNGVSNLGSMSKKYLTLHAWELWVDTLVARNTIATIGGRIIVAPTSELAADVAVSDACIRVKHNAFRANDTVLLQKDGKFEKMLLGTGPIDCSVSGNCGAVTNAYDHCSVTRNRDGTGANEWLAGDAVVGEGNVGDGYIDMYSDRSATSEGYVGQIVSDGPVAYWRMSESPSGQTVDVMGNVGNAVEQGTPSSGLGTLAGLLGTTNSDPVFDNRGATGYLEVANAADLQITADLTIEWWMYRQSATPSTSDIISRGGVREYAILVDGNGAMSFCHGNGSVAECETTANSFVSAGGADYTHYAIVRDATSSPKRVLFYKDGVLAETHTYTQTVTTSTNVLRIGDNPDVGARYLDGDIDEVAIYNYQVSADRLLLHFNARKNNSISKFAIGPTLIGNVRTGTGAFDVSERWVLGNLAGTYGYNSTTPVYGMVAGSYAADWVSMDATNGHRNMYGDVTKWQVQGGNMFLTGDLSIGTAGSLRSGATAYDTGTGYWLDYNAGTPRFRIGTTSAGTDFLRYTGSALELKSNQLSIGNGGISLPARDTDSYNAAYGFDFRSIWAGGIGMWAYDDTSTSRRWLRHWNTVTTASKTALVQLLASDADTDQAIVTVSTGTTASSDSVIDFSASSITVDLSNTGATANVSCGAGTAIKTLNVRKGIIIATPTCAAP
jgi:hypothetical protein